MCAPVRNVGHSASLIRLSVSPYWLDGERIFLAVTMHQRMEKYRAMAAVATAAATPSPNMILPPSTLMMPVRAAGINL